MVYKYSEDDYRLRVELPSDHPDDIRVMLNIPNQKNIKKIKVVLSSDEADAAERVDPPFNPFRSFSYFKILDGEGNTVTSFDPPLRIRITYTSEAWYMFTDTEPWLAKGRPRACFLEKTTENWGRKWDEIPDGNINYKAPDETNHTGFIRITTSKVPDPRIGGC